MISAGEEKNTIKQLGGLTYRQDDPLTEAGTVMGGEWDGWKVAPCSDMNNTTELVGIQLTPEVAAEFKRKFQLNREQFHLNLDLTGEWQGSFCFPSPIRSSIKVEQMKNGLQCQMVDGVLDDKVTWQAPLGSYTPCDVMKKNLMPGYMTFLDHLHEISKDASWKAVATGGGILTLLVGGTAAGYTFFKGGAMYQARAAKKAANTAAKKAAKDATKAAVKEGVEEAAETGAKKAVKAALAETGEEAVEGAAKGALRTVARETAEEGVEAGVKKGMQAAARKAPVPFWAKAAIFVTIEVGAALLMADSAEASEAGRAKFGDHFESDREFESKKTMKDSCGESTGCYLANWALAPVGWVAESVSTPAY